MANQVAARLSGDDYQHLFAWWLVLNLKRPSQSVKQITIENALAGSVDDVTVRHEIRSDIADRFYQIKFHVDQRKIYSVEELIAHKPGETSLLEKFWRTWNVLNGQNLQRKIELWLVSNWAWDAHDALGACFDGHDHSIRTEIYFSETAKSAIRESRSCWQQKLKASDEEFRAFIGCLRFWVSFDSSRELERRVAERMELLGLKSDESALYIASGIVREWIKAGKQELDLEALEDSLKAHDLYLREEQEKSLTIYLTTIKEQKFDLAPDYIIDWRDYFNGDAYKKGHQLLDPSAWNNQLLPELKQLEAQVNQETSNRIIKVRGKARLAPWFAFGFSFSEVVGYTIEVEQRDKLYWRTDAKPDPRFQLTITNHAGSPEGEVLDGEGSTVAVGISITASLDEDVRNYLADYSEKVAAWLLLRPERELGQRCLRSAEDAVALADNIKKYTRAFVKKWHAKRLLFFYLGPLSGACFLGHGFNAVCQEIQVMEYQQPGYAPSFLLE